MDILADADLPERGIKEGDNLKLEYHEGALRIYGPYFGKTVTLDGGVYHAQEISFHTPSEHKINGERFQMEMRVVHYGKTVGDTAKQVVLCFLFKKAPGVYNRFIESLETFNLPNPLDKYRELQKRIQLTNIFFNTNEDPSSTMSPFSFYTYEGSLTRPPCNEKTITYVASEPIGISATTLALFKEALRFPDLESQHGEVFSQENSIMYSNRSIQNLNGRSVFHYNSKFGCLTKRMKTGYVGTTKGHYERKTTKAEKFFYVEGDQPSGMPNAFVVTEDEARNSHSPELFGNEKRDLLNEQFYEQELKRIKEIDI